jgi:tetratricopeptide (TPR) repeat protein
MPPRRTPASPAPSNPPPATPAGPAVKAAPAAPAPRAPEAAPAPETPSGKRRGASFYEPYLSTGDALDREIIELTAKVREHPFEAGLRNDLGNLLARRGFAKEAADQYRKAAKLDSEFFLADYNEGILWEKEGKTSAAIKAYERSIKRKPGFPLSRFHLGFLLEKEGRTGGAIGQYAKALRIDPSLRWPARNPLVVQTRLLYLASLENYDRDLAGAGVADEVSFADRAVWERLHPQRPVDTAELQAEAPEDEEPAPAVVGIGSPAAAPLIGGKATATAPAKPADARRQQLIERFRRNRAAQPAPPRTVVAPAPPPAAVPAPPEDENAPNPAMQQEEPPPSVA